MRHSHSAAEMVAEGPISLELAPDLRVGEKEALIAGEAVEGGCWVAMEGEPIGLASNGESGEVADVSPRVRRPLTRRRVPLELLTHCLLRMCPALYFVAFKMNA
jgi:hypothetical protein